LGRGVIAGAAGDDSGAGAAEGEAGAGSHGPT
jgi:hypothetical protein